MVEDAKTQKRKMKATLEIANEVRNMHGGEIPEMTPERVAQLEQNIVNKIMSKGDLTHGTKAERLARIDRDLMLSEHTDNAALQSLRKALIEERVRVVKLKD